MKKKIIIDKIFGYISNIKINGLISIISILIIASIISNAQSKFPKEIKIDSILNLHGKDIDENSIKYRIDKYVLVSILFFKDSIILNNSKNNITSNIVNNTYEQQLNLYKVQQDINNEQWKQYIESVEKVNKFRENQNAEAVKTEENWAELYGGKRQDASVPQAGLRDPTTGEPTVLFGIRKQEPMVLKPPVPQQTPLIVNIVPPPSLNYFPSSSESYKYQGSNDSIDWNISKLSREISDYLNEYEGSYEAALTALINGKEWKKNNNYPSKVVIEILENSKLIKKYMERKKK